MKTANSQMDTMPMTDRPTVEQALRYVENGKICDPYVLLDVLAAEVKRLRASQLFPASGDMVSCDPAPNAARGFPAHGVGRTYKL